MKLKNAVLYLSVLLISLSLVLCGCSKDETEESTTYDNGLSTYTPPDYGTEDAPEDAGTLGGDDGEAATRPAQLP